MKPLSDFTTPRRLIALISRHFFPVEQPEPVGCCTTGLKKGSRLPFIAHFFSSGFGGLRASALLADGLSAGFSLAAILVVGTEGLAAGLETATFAAAAGAGALATGAAFATLAAAGAGALAAGPAFATFEAGVGGAATGLAATVCTLAAGAEVFAGTGAGVLFATADVCSVKTSVLPGPGVTS